MQEPQVLPLHDDRVSELDMQNPYSTPCKAWSSKDHHRQILYRNHPRESLFQELTSEHHWQVYSLPLRYGTVLLMEHDQHAAFSLV
jgi:hypothetical protein